MYRTLIQQTKQSLRNAGRFEFDDFIAQGVAKSNPRISGAFAKFLPFLLVYNRSTILHFLLLFRCDDCRINRFNLSTTSEDCENKQSWEQSGEIRFHGVSNAKG